MNKKLLITGSHAGSTAIAIVEEIKNQKKDWDIHWVGKRYAEEGKKSHTLEFNHLEKLGVKYHVLESGKIQTKFTRYTLPALFKIPIAFIKTPFLVNKINPDLVLSLGGSSGALVSFWAWIFKVPIIVHEQTSSAGRANIFSAKFAKVVALSRDSSQKYFGKSQIILTGNPINSYISKYLNVKRNKNVKTILFTGGSRGSVWINNALRPILQELTTNFKIIHQTGDANINEFKDIKSKNYFPFGQTDPYNMARIISQSDIVVSRAGANTVSELIAFKKPSLLIPIPWSYLDEQTENAKYMMSLGLARILRQDDLTPTSLLTEINELVKDYTKIVADSDNLITSDIKASSKIVNLLSNYI